MKILFIGGTGTISSAISRMLLANGNHQLYLLNRGNKNNTLAANANTIVADINNEADVAKKIQTMQFDVVADFIAFESAHLERDYRLFAGKTKQFIFISSASAYQKPLSSPFITESTPLANPYWEYSRQKIACEEYLMKQYRTTAFPITIVRPSHTYCECSVPVAVHGNHGSWSVIERMRHGKPVIIPGDGTSLWTLTHNRDFAQAFIGLMGNIHAIGEAVQITSDETMSWNQIHSCIANALDVPLHPYFVPSDFLAAVSNYDFTGGLIGDKANSVIFNNHKIKQLVPSFTAITRFDIGVVETLQYIFEHPECQTADPEFDQWCDRVIEQMEAAKKRLLNNN
jgi:nucleoside-diphosphate-sugar epimerase